MRTPWLLSVVAALVGAAAGCASPDTTDDSTTAPGAGGTVVRLTMDAPRGRCVVPSPARLARADLALEGSVASLSSGRVTLEPTSWYAGERADHVVVGPGDAGAAELVGAIDFRPGQDYLVAATSGKVMLCGFSGERTPDLASLYRRAFPDGPS